MRTSSFFQNAQLYGAPANVRGGLYYTSEYSIKVEGKGYVSIKGKKIYIGRTRQVFSNAKYVREIKKYLESNGYDAIIESKSEWQHIRDPNDLI